MLSSKLQLTLRDRKVLAALCALIFFVASVSTIIGYQLGTKAQSSTLTMQTNSEGAQPGAPTYTIFTENGVYYAKDAYGAISWSSTNQTTLLNSVVSTLVGGGKISFVTGNYTINGIVTIQPNTSDNALLIFEGGGGVNLLIDTPIAFNLVGQRRVSFDNFHVKMLQDNSRFLNCSMITGGDRTIYRSALSNLYFDANGMSNLNILALYDSFQMTGRNINFIALQGGSTAMTLSCNVATSSGDCVFSQISCTRSGESIFMYIYGTGIVGGGYRQNDLFSGIMGYDIGGEWTTPAIQMVNSTRESFESPSIQIVNAYSYDVGCDQNQIIGQETQVNVINNGTNLMLNTGSFHSITQYSGSMTITGVSYLEHLTSTGGSININSLYQMGNAPSFTDTNYRIGIIGDGYDNPVITGNSTDPANPSYPIASAKGASDNQCLRNKEQIKITIPAGTVAGYYYYGVYNVWTDGVRDCTFNYEFDSGDTTYGTIRVINVRDYGSDKILVVVQVLSTLAGNEVVRVWTEQH